MKWCRSCILPDTRPNLTLDADGICNACRNHGTKRQIDWDARAAALRDARRNGQGSGERLRLPDPGLRRQGQHLAGRQVPGARPEAARRHLAAAGAHRHRPAQPRQPDRARRRSHRLQHRSRGRAQAHAQGLRALRLDRDRHAHGALRHPADPGGAVSHPAGGVGRELRVRIRQRRGGAHRLRARWRLAHDLRRHARHHGRRLDRRGADRQGPHALLLALGRGAGRGRRARGVSRLLLPLGPAGDLPRGRARMASARTRRRAPATTTTPTSTTTSSRSTTG